MPPQPQSLLQVLEGQERTTLGKGLHQTAKIDAPKLLWGWEALDPVERQAEPVSHIEGTHPFVTASIPGEGQQENLVAHIPHLLLSLLLETPVLTFSLPLSPTVHLQQLPNQLWQENVHLEPFNICTAQLPPQGLSPLHLGPGQDLDRRGLGGGGPEG